MNKLQYYTPTDSKLPDGYCVVRKCSNCRHLHQWGCLNGAPMPDPVVGGVTAVQTWLEEHSVDPDGWCPEHIYTKE